MTPTDEHRGTPVRATAHYRTDTARRRAPTPPPPAPSTTDPRCSYSRSQTASLTLIMPRGAPAELRFDGPKVSDPDNDQVDITHTFRKPDDSRETTPGEMLLEHRTEEFNELFHSATGVDIAAFTETYRAGTGETVLTGTITVSDGVAQAELAFTLSVRFDPSPQYAGPASHLNGQRWKIPQVCVVPEGAQTSPAATVAWTSLTTTAFTWAAGTEVDTPGCLRHRPGGLAQCNSRGLWTLPSLRTLRDLREKRTSRSAPRRDFENPADQNRDNEYQARIYGTHQDGGCTGSAVDVVVRVRDIAAPPRGAGTHSPVPAGTPAEHPGRVEPTAHNRLERAGGLAPRRELSGGVPPGR